MLFNQLSEQDKEYILPIAQLLSLADKPLLWDGKKRDEVTVHGNLNNITIQIGERESALLADWAQNSDFLPMDAENIANRLLEKIKNVPLHQIEEPTTRVTAISEVLRTLLEKHKTSGIPSVIKLMQFELMLLALADGSISTIEYHVLNAFKHHHKLDDFTFGDLLERAESTHREAQKTIALILE